MVRHQGESPSDSTLLCKGGPWYAKQVALLSLLPVLVAGALSCHFRDSDLTNNSIFKLAVVVSTLLLCTAYAFLAWFSTPVNDQGYPVRTGVYGKREGYDVSRKFYCGRALPIPGTEGHCGTHNGPQCTSCKDFQKNWGTKWYFWYFMYFHPVLELTKWAAPCVSLTIFFLLWGAPERDLRCGPEDWSPMIPVIGHLYLPEPGSAEDKVLQDDLLLLSNVNPLLPLPELLFPAMNNPLTLIPRLQRVFYFVSTLAFMTGTTCFLLETARLIMKTIQPLQQSELALPMMDTSSFRDRNSFGHLGKLSPLERLLVISFAVWYITYQVVLYILMDYGVAHGLMNLTTGIAWELWIPFMDFVLATAIITGVARYVASSRHGAHEHPTPLLLMQLMPWLGNELHVMKDHIATALCFAAAHCYTGTLRAVGILLGYLSFAATFIPVVVLLTDSRSFKALRNSHWPILEGAFARTQRCTASEKRWRKAVGIGVDMTTKDKYIRAISGEVPHAFLHVVFAFFFGGSFFIVSAIILSAVKIFCIPVGRTWLRSVIPCKGCSELSLQKFLANAGGRLKWHADPIVWAYKFDWCEVIAEFRSLHPLLDKVYKDEAEGNYPPEQPLDLPDIGAWIKSVLEGVLPFYNSLVAPAWTTLERHIITEQSKATTVNPMHSGKKKAKATEEEEEESDGEDVKLDGQDSGEEHEHHQSDTQPKKQVHRLKVIVTRTRRKNLAEYMATLEFLMARLGWIDEKEVVRLLQDVYMGKMDAKGLDMVPEIYKMGAVKAPDFRHFREKFQKNCSEETAQAVAEICDQASKEQAARKSVKKDAGLDMFLHGHLPEEHSKTKSEQELKVKEAIQTAVRGIEMQIIKGVVSITLGLPLIVALAALV